MVVRICGWFVFLVILFYVFLLIVEEVKFGFLIFFKSVGWIGNNFYWGEFFVFVMSIVVDDINWRFDFFFGINVIFIWNDIDCEEFKML